jgi:hypothetical protein
LLIVGGLFGSSASIPTQRAVTWFTDASVAARLNRGSAFDTARRHAGPAGMKHAIGFTDADRKSMHRSDQHMQSNALCMNRR